MKEKKLLIYKVFIILLGFSSIFLLYTQDIYMYEVLSVKSLSMGLWIGIVVWILFLINAMILSFITNREVTVKFNKIRNIMRNAILLGLITILLAYRLGNGLLTLYKMSNKVFNTWIYVIFGIIFVIYLVATVIMNRIEDKDSKENDEKSKTVKKVKSKTVKKVKK